MRTTVNLDPDVYEAAMHLAKISGERLGKVLSDLARRGLQPAPHQKQGRSARFPTFDVSPNAPKLSVRKIQQIIDEEGLF